MGSQGLVTTAIVTPVTISAASIKVALVCGDRISCLHAADHRRSRDGGRSRGSRPPCSSCLSWYRRYPSSWDSPRSLVTVRPAVFPLLPCLQCTDAFAVAQLGGDSGAAWICRRLPLQEVLCDGSDSSAVHRTLGTPWKSVQLHSHYSSALLCKFVRFRRSTARPNHRQSNRELGQPRRQWVCLHCHTRFLL